MLAAPTLSISVENDDRLVALAQGTSTIVAPKKET